MLRKVSIRPRVLPLAGTGCGLTAADGHPVIRLGADFFDGLVFSFSAGADGRVMRAKLADTWYNLSLAKMMTDFEINSLCAGL